MAQSLLLPAAVALLCAVIVWLFAKPKQTVAWTAQAGASREVEAPEVKSAEAPRN